MSFYDPYRVTCQQQNPAPLSSSSGFAVVGLEALGRRFVTHNEGFHFAVALPTPSCIQTELVAIVGRQIESAERRIALMGSNRPKLRCYEEIFEID